MRTIGKVIALWFYGGLNRRRIKSSGVRQSKIIINKVAPSIVNSEISGEIKPTHAQTAQKFRTTPCEMSPYVFECRTNS
jgi:hypothetical protein